MAIFYITIGIKHFSNFEWFMKIMPPYIPHHKNLVLLSGLIEILLGFFLIFKKTRRYSALGLIILLIAVFPANIYLAQTNGMALGISPYIAWFRLPFQLVFIILD